MQDKLMVTNLICLWVIWGLSIFCLFDVFYHLPQERVTVILILCHQHLQHEPQAPEKKKLI